VHVAARHYSARSHGLLAQMSVRHAVSERVVTEAVGNPYLRFDSPSGRDRNLLSTAAGGAEPSGPETAPRACPA
jgi:DNA-binding IclR family transcriptional regulator